MGSAVWLDMDGGKHKGDKMKDEVDLITIRSHDEVDGEIITISAVWDECDGIEGYMLSASNGDEMASCEPQSLKKCVNDCIAQWGGWQTFTWVM